MSEARRIPGASKRSLAIELAVVTVACLVVIHVLYLSRGVPFIASHLSYFVAYILIGVPILVLWLRRRSLDFFSFGLGSLLRSLKVFVVTSIIIFVPFLVLAHFWQKLVWGLEFKGVAGFPDFWSMLIVQILVVALPEEFYFRGYFQSTMDRIFRRRWRIFGVHLGWGWLLTAIIFAFAHTIITYKWWHFAIFFPALVFGYLRERTGLIIAPTLFHAASNLLMSWFVRCYY
jgi:membrane protease YdiL (CAAX protease family)